MKHLMLSVAVIAVCGLLGFIHAQQKTDVPEDWAKISICHLSFFAPSALKDLGTKGVDSCVAQFGNNQITLYLDYGRYGGPIRQNNSYVEIKKQFISIDGKDAELITFIDDTRANSGRKYLAALYVEVKESATEGLPKTISLMMSVTGDAAKDQEMAQRIFRTIRFE